MKFSDPEIVGNGPRLVRRLTFLSLPSLITLSGAGLLILLEVLGVYSLDFDATGTTIALMVMSGLILTAFSFVQIATGPAAVMTSVAAVTLAKRNPPPKISRAVWLKCAALICACVAGLALPVALLAKWLVYAITSS